MTSNVLKNVRAHLDSGKTKELNLLHSDHTAQEYWNELQQLRREMSQELFDVNRTIREKYAEQIAQLEHEYAMYLAMITPSQEQST